MALAAAAGLLLIEDDTVRLAFLVTVCALALGVGRLRGESDSPAREGAQFLAPVVAAIPISSLAFEDDRQKLVSAIVLTLIFSLGWRVLRRRRLRSA